MEYSWRDRYYLAQFCSFLAKFKLSKIEVYRLLSQLDVTLTIGDAIPVQAGQVGHPAATSDASSSSSAVFGSERGTDHA